MDPYLLQNISRDDKKHSNSALILLWDNRYWIGILARTISLFWFETFHFSKIEIHSPIVDMHFDEKKFCTTCMLQDWNYDHVQYHHIYDIAIVGETSDSSILLFSPFGCWYIKQIINNLKVFVNVIFKKKDIYSSHNSI